MKKSGLWKKYPIFKKLHSGSLSKYLKSKRISWGMAALNAKLCTIKSSHRKRSIKKGVLKNLTKFTEKTNSNTSFFLLILGNF